MATATKPAKPSLDLTALVPVAAEIPKVARERKHKDNPFVAWLAESYESKAGKSVTVPDANVGEVEYLIRRAADELGIGSRVVKNPADKKGQTVVIFAGKDRKSRKDARSTDATE